MAYSLSSFGPEFVFAEGEPYDSAGPTDPPSSVWSAIQSMPEDEWNEVADSVFGVEPEFLTAETVLGKIMETDTVSNLSSPVRVWIDEEGWHTVEVYDSRSENPRRSAKRSKSVSRLKNGLE